MPKLYMLLKTPQLRTFLVLVFGALHQDPQRGAFCRYLKPTKIHPFEGTGRGFILHIDFSSQLR